MAARRAAGTAPPRGFKGGGKGYPGNGNSREGGPAFALGYPHLDQQPPTMQSQAQQFGAYGGGPFGTASAGSGPPMHAEIGSQ